jgi:hydrogenase small subunit
MAEATAPYGRKTQARPAIEEIDILWLTAGLACDRDTISITAATQPGLEDVLLGALPGLPRVRLHNPVLAYETGDDFLAVWHRADEGKLDPFLLVVEGSIPNEKNKGEGYWAAFGADRATGQPIPTCDWIDRLAPGRGPWWRPDRAPPTAASTPCRATRPAAWAWPTTSAGAGNQQRGCRS